MGVGLTPRFKHPESLTKSLTCLVRVPVYQANHLPHCNRGHLYHTNKELCYPNIAR